MAEWISGNIFIRSNRKVAGEVVDGHGHNFDHTTTFFSGKWRVEATLQDGTKLDRIFEAPSHALIRAGVEHKITCLEDGEYWCLYSHRTPQGEVSVVNTGWGPAYV